MTATEYRHITTEQDCRASFGVMQELRPHLADLDAYVAQVARQMKQGYCLLGAWQDGQVLALAGYRQMENLIYGRFIYIDDLVTSASVRSQGLGQQLIAAVRDEVRRQGCSHLVLDTGLGNALGQRFYFRQGLLAMGLHFRERVAEQP